MDTETTPIVDHAVSEYVLGAVTDGAKGFFLPPASVFEFLSAHWGTDIIFHNAPFDLAVLHALLKAQQKALDIYALVEQHKVWDTLLLHKLYTLATAGHTSQGKGQSTLEKCAQLYLDVALPKVIKDGDGDDIRLSWGKWKDKPPAAIPSISLEYLAKDVLCTFGCFNYLLPRILETVENAHKAFGYVDSTWLEEQWARYGPQTHTLQLMGAIALNDIERNGFGLDLANRNEVLGKAQGVLDELREAVRLGGCLAGQKGSDKALQVLIRKALYTAPGIDVPRTATGKYSTKKDALNVLAEVSDFFARYKEHKAVRLLITHHLCKMDTQRVHSHYDALKTTGRTSASGPNIQNLPKQRDKKKGKQHEFDIRRCFVAPEGKVLYVVDYAGIELRTLAQALKTQFNLDSQLAKAINAGADLHRLVAARMKASALPNAAEVLASPEQFSALMASVTKDERDGAKPTNFGLPAGMGWKALKGYARAQCGQPYTDEDAQGWLAAWLASFPEMVQYRQDEVDIAQALAERLQLTPANYAAATGEWYYAEGNEEHVPTAWLGAMTLKVLKEPVPRKGSGAEYTPAILDYFWGQLQQLAPHLDGTVRSELAARKASPKLRFAVQKLINKASVITITARLRANASYSARRNTIFQGAAADGAKLALYRLWRTGFKVVAFIHDEVVTEVDENADLPALKEQIDNIMIGAMQEICPNMLIEVEGNFRRRWGNHKDDKVALPVVNSTESFTQEVVVMNK
jgi:DNA polymerase I-like protein with 3'-5' exonuclease and polymerase domains